MILSTNDQLSKMSDEALYELCRKFGTQAIAWRRKFIGLLPEANRRRLYIKKRFRTIFDFAFLLGGVSSAQVTLAVSLDRLFEDKPALRKFLIQGLVSINKLARIASVVTKETEEFWAKQVTQLSYRALETLVRDHRLANREVEENRLGPLFENFAGFGFGFGKSDFSSTQLSNLNFTADKPGFAADPASMGNRQFISLTDHAVSDTRQISPFVDQVSTAIPGHDFPSGNPPIPSAVPALASPQNSWQNQPSSPISIAQNGLREPQNAQQFLRAQNFQLHPSILKLQLSPLAISKLLELQNKGIDINKIILELITEREENISQTKEHLSENLQPAKSRYIPAQVKKVIAEEHGQKCSIKNCSKPATVVHHTQRYALARTHDPNFMAPLCKEHHLIAHSIDTKFHETRANALGP